MTTNSRTSRNQIEKIGAGLSERDWSIVRFVEQHRYATTSQIRRSFFTEHTSQSAATRACVRVLNRLLSHRILTRLERRVGGVRHGSAAFIWCLDVVGDRLIRPKHASRRRFHEPSYAFLAHTLAITETHVQLDEAAHAGMFLLTTVEIETEAWRSFVTPGGAKSMLKPDLFVTISGEDYDDHWYIEIDLGTESLPVLLRKCVAYEEYRRTGRAQNEHGVFPRVLWAMSDDVRVARLKEAITSDAHLSDRLFICTTRESLISIVRDPL